MPRTELHYQWSCQFSSNIMSEKQNSYLETLSYLHCVLTEWNTVLLRTSKLKLLAIRTPCPHSVGAQAQWQAGTYEGASSWSLIPTSTPNCANPLGQQVCGISGVEQKERKTLSWSCQAHSGGELTCVWEACGPGQLWSHPWRDCCLEGSAA